MSVIGDPLLIGSTGGGGGGFIIVETPDPAGGTVLTITGTQVKLQAKSATPSETAQTVTPDTGDGYIGLSQVNVGAVSSTYIGSDIPVDPTPTASGATVTIPTGYYSTGTTKSVSSGTEGTPAATKGTVSNHSINITPSVTNTAGYISGGTKTGTAVSVSASELVSGTKSITSNGTNIDVTEYAAVDVAVQGGTPNLQTKTKSYTPSETAQSESVSYDSGYDGLDTVSISVGAISSTYVGSGITQRTSSDLSANGATVTAPAGYYANAGTYTIASGSATTPSTNITATPSISVSSAGVITATASTTKSITPTVSAGYVSSGTAGNVVVYGTKTENLTTQAAQTIHPSTVNQTISSGKYLTGTQTFAAVTTTNLTAANIKSGVTIEVGDSSDSDRVASVTGTYTGGGGMNVQIAAGVNRVNTTAYSAVSGQSITVSVSGTYDVYWVGFRSSTGGTNGSQLYIDGVAYGSAPETTFTNHAQAIHLTGVSLTKDQVVTVRARARGTSYYMYVGDLTIRQTA